MVANGNITRISDVNSYVRRDVNKMARKRLSLIGEEGRKYLKKMGAIDDRYRDGREDIIAKETGKHRRGEKSSGD